jgi:peptidoglycan hydrolase-like protein with peptidoglycan-binding domain
VRILQQLLNTWRSHVPGRPPLILDGIFGPRTQAAIIAFQRGRSLPADGVAGARTWSALQAAHTRGRP